MPQSSQCNRCSFFILDELKCGFLNKLLDINQNYIPVKHDDCNMTDKPTIKNKNYPMPSSDEIATPNNITHDKSEAIVRRETLRAIGVRNHSNQFKTHTIQTGHIPFFGSR